VGNDDDHFRKRIEKIKSRKSPLVKTGTQIVIEKGK